MVGQGLSREKAFVPGPGTMMILSHQKSNNRKSNRPFVFKLIPGESPAHDASFCISKHFHCDFVDSVLSREHPRKDFHHPRKKSFTTQEKRDTLPLFMLPFTLLELTTQSKKLFPD